MMLVCGESACKRILEFWGHCSGKESDPFAEVT